MGLSLPFSKHKRYLTGIDWIINMFDHMLKQSSGAGNASQIMLELDGILPAERLRAAFKDFSRHLPVLRGRLARDFNLAPYWKFPAPDSGLELELEIPVSTFPADQPTDPILSELATRVNSPFPHDTDHIHFDLAHHGDARTFLVMRFDHRIFDARGAESFLHLLHHYVSQGHDASVLKDISWTEPAHLSDWKLKFLAGRQINRALQALAKSSHRLHDFSAIPKPGCRFRFIRFSARQSAAIVESAYSQAGYLMLMPYLLARCIQALHRVFLDRGIRVPNYIIPISLDMRAGNTLPKTLFFNHVSFLFLDIKTGDVEDRPRLIKSIIAQMYEQTKSGQLNAFGDASMLMRIVPLPLLTRIARLPLKGEFGSLAFSHINETAYLSPDFLNHKVLNLIHTPRVPIPPGFGFFFNTYGGTLNAIFCFVPELINDKLVAQVMAELENLAPTD
jgi:hypothetical protein